MFFYIFVLPKGNFDIDAGDGGGGVGGDHLGPKIINKTHKIRTKKVRTKIIHTSGTIFKKCIEIFFKISSYKITEKDNESDKRIQNNNL